MPKAIKAAIHEIASPEVVQRGEDYFETGAVLSLVRRGNQLQAEVQGSDYEPYRVTVALGPRGTVADYGCTCPYDWGGACKHVVAALLAYQHDPRQVEERPPLQTLLADLDAEQVRQLLVNLAGRLPAATDVIEAEVAELRRRRKAQRQGGPEATSRRRGRRPPRPDPSQVRRQVIAALHSLDGMRRPEAYWHVREAIARVRAVAEQAVKSLKARDARGALIVLDALTEEYIAGWTILDDSDGVAGGFFGDLHHLWTEAMLAANADLTDAERTAWVQRLSGWQNELRDYELDDVFDEPLAILLSQWEHPERLEEVIETYGDAYPEWAMTACRNQAQRLLEQGTSKDYDQAVRWLARAQVAAADIGELEAWKSDLGELIARHSRKRRLVTLLRKLRRRRRPR